MSAKDTINKFNKVAQKNEDSLKKNPFSETYSIQSFDSKSYGRPPPGSKTEARGIRAGDYICREILFLCETINSNAEVDGPYKWMKFGRLFYIYSFYSDKLVGMLIRARKYGLVHFEGEMLYQGQDNEKVITMLMTIEEIRQGLQASGDPAKCVSIVRQSSTTTETPFTPAPPPQPTSAPKPFLVSSASVNDYKSKFEAKNNVETVPVQEERRKKPWTPRDTTKAPVFCSGS